ncbi:hypothetical protein NDU88_003246 [Pleurodeles waltl]|uniref:Uncharacterized protein n=1 Tax=Pleurodeles waltl TaxID=8319 RepID=A0AAV7UDH0_PLEWA|nr:hypothetical protein NDU88_003246 [Pleurodeles waltl]
MPCRMAAPIDTHILAAEAARLPRPDKADDLPGGDAFDVQRHRPGSPVPCVPQGLLQASHGYEVAFKSASSSTAKGRRG